MRADSEGGRQGSCTAPYSVFSRCFQLELKTEQTPFPALRLRCKRFRFPYPLFGVVRHYMTTYPFRLAKKCYSGGPFLKFFLRMDVAPVEKTFCSVPLIQKEICRYSCIRSTAYMKDQSLFIIHVFERRPFISAILLPLLLPQLQLRHLRQHHQTAPAPAMEESSLQRSGSRYGLSSHLRALCG